MYTELDFPDTVCLNGLGVPSCQAGRDLPRKGEENQANRRKKASKPHFKPLTGDLRRFDFAEMGDG